MLWYVARSVVVFALAGAFALLLRRRPAADRHLVWLAAFVAVAAMPLFGRSEPVVRVTAPPAAARVLRPLAPETVPPAPAPESPDVAVAATESAIDAAPETTAAPAFDPLAAASALYWLGLALVLARYGWGASRVARASRDAAPMPGFNGRVRLMGPAGFASPMTYGWPRATILFPEAAREWPEGRLHAALAHEWAHVQRADWVWQCLALAVCAAQWFNPFAWMAAARLRAEAENAADDAVLRDGVSPSAYAQELLALARSVRHDAVVAVAMTRPGSLGARVRAILDRNRDRRPATARARWVAGTGPLFLATALGGVGLGAAVANAPLPQRRSDPFRYAPLGGTGSGQTMHGYFDGYVVTQAQSRPPFGPAQAWDGIGRTTFLHLPTAPRPAAVPNRKVREIVLSCPDGRAPIVELPKGAELLQVFAIDRVALVAGAFPPDAEVTSMRLGVPRPQSLTFDRFKPARVAGPQGRSYGKGLVWFSVPPGARGARCHLADASMKTLPIAAEYLRPNGFQRLLAAKAEVAKRVRWIAYRMEPLEWTNYRNLLLDPATPAEARPDAPLGEVPLDQGGVAEVWRIARTTIGRPMQTWAVDGGAPRPAPRDVDSTRSYSMPSEPNMESRNVYVRLKWPGRQKIDVSVRWQPTAPIRSTGSGTSIRGGEAYANVELQVPQGLPKGSIRMGYAIGPWRTVADEPLGGPRLRVTAPQAERIETRAMAWIRFDVPPAWRGLNQQFEIVDKVGKVWTPTSLTAPAGDDGKDDGSVRADFDGLNPANIARVRLKVRDWHWVELRDLPMQPR
jgi:hypothetical protein